jgi:hypothetical protein
MVPTIQPTKIEPPIYYTPENVIYWEENSKQLIMEGSASGKVLLQKAKNFIREDCIVMEGRVWKCKPIKNYNTKTYTIENKDVGLVCNCQGCQTKIKNNENPFCCHILAVHQFIFINRQVKQ